MTTLSTDLRKALENTVRKARDLAEEALRASIQALGVEPAKVPAHLDDEGLKLRRQLRAHGRQLGDALHADGGQAVTKLVHEGAYEHWHRMLFARFLAENGLLIHPEHSVGVTLAECEELAQEEGCDAWELAGRYASRMLPQIFRPEDPVLQIKLAPEHQQALEKLLADLPLEVFQAEDSLGWVYQFWQAKRKDEVNKSEVKIGAEELPAVTQLFTEDYMVLFLLHNTLGAWWAGKNLKQDGQERGEEEWRDACVVNGYRFDYLRLLPDGTPVSGTFNDWPKMAKDLTLLDPCMGSGHFLVFALPILVAFRMAEEGLTEAAAIEAVLSCNLHGLEIDPRCTQLAAFNLAFAAWRRTGFCHLPALNLACCGLKPQSTRSEWLALAGDNEQVLGALDELYTLFQQAQELGSLLNPRLLEQGGFFGTRLEEINQALQKVLKTGDDEPSQIRIERAVTARGLASAAWLLGQKFSLVMTNVPYLGIRKQDSAIRLFCERNFPRSKHDLATVFLERSLELVTKGGVTALVTPSSWMFSGSYELVRKALLGDFNIKIIADLGSGAFQTIGGEVVNVNLSIIENKNDIDNFLGINLSNINIESKINNLSTSNIQYFSRQSQFTNPDARIILDDISAHPILNQYAQCLAGIQNGDSPRFLRNFWEFQNIEYSWVFMQSAVEKSSFFDGLDTLIYFDRENGHLRAPANWRRSVLHDSDQRGKPIWGKKGVLISRMCDLPSTLYLGHPYDQGSAAIVPNDPEILPAIYCFCASEDYSNEVRKIDKKLNVTSATLSKIGFDLSYWKKRAQETYPSGLPSPYSADLTQWIFHGHPRSAVEPLQVATARLLGYLWPAELDPSIDLSVEARAMIELCSDLAPFMDEDGIVPIPAMRGEQPAADRLRQILALAYGQEWSPSLEQGLLKSVGYTGRSLDSWLRDGFFEQHFKLFHQRPFIWHVWDGLRDGFSVLVNYHKLDRKGLESLAYSYLGDWITRQTEAVTRSESGAQGKLERAMELQKKLVAILEGESPNDIFVRWKPLEQQPIGWEPDLNDGVRLNIRPFVSAGVLRKDPKINWNKDRGKDVESAPWFKVFDGDRINDHHLTLNEKRAARAKH